MITGRGLGEMCKGMIGRRIKGRGLLLWGLPLRLPRRSRVFSGFQSLSSSLRIDASQRVCRGARDADVLIVHELDNAWDRSLRSVTTLGYQEERLITFARLLAVERSKGGGERFLIATACAERQYRYEH